MRASRRVLAVALLMLPSASWACAVCFGDPASPLTLGLNAGILVLLGFVGVVFGGVVAFLIAMRRRIHEARTQSGPGGNLTPRSVS